jgi:hypothetical protein
MIATYQIYVVVLTPLEVNNVCIQKHISSDISYLIQRHQPPSTSGQLMTI